MPDFACWGNETMKNPSKIPAIGDRLKLAYLLSGTAHFQPGQILGPRLLDDFEGVLIIEGHPVYETQHGEYRLEPGSIVLAQPGTHETYRWDSNAPTLHAYFHFSLEEIPADWPDPVGWPCCRIHPEQGLGELFRHIVERAAQHTDWSEQCPETSVSRVFEAFLELYLNPTGTFDEPALKEFSEPIRRAAKYMRWRLDEPVFSPFSLEDLAMATNVSSAHLCHLFNRELGISPLRACRLMQLQLAIPLLARSNLSIKAIASRCGFSDQLHFSRSFTRAFGQSPSLLRRKMQNGMPPPAPMPQSYLFMPRVRW